MHPEHGFHIYSPGLASSKDSHEIPDRSECSGGNVILVQIQALL